MRSKQVTAAEVEAVARKALAAADTNVNALAAPLFDPALSWASGGPLAGVPIVIKDGGPFARGVPFRLGSRALRGVASDDHDLMARFRAAGLVALGLSTAPELGLSFATEAKLYGPTRNPWGPDRGVGGSSGGAAALVAAGAVPIAHANDGGGSVRIPASCCGLVGLKPSRGRTPCGPLVGEACFGQLVEFAVTRTVRDAAHLLDAVSATPVGDAHQAPPPTRPYAQELHAQHGRLRIAVMTAPWSGTAVDPQVADATVAAARTLEWIGHQVTEAGPAIDPEAVATAAMLSAVATGAAVLAVPHQPDPRLLEAVSRRILGEARDFRATDVMAALDAQNRVSRPAGLFFLDHDVLVTPTLAQLPAPHGTLDSDDARHTVRSWLDRLFEYGPFTAVWNVSGHPAISLPLGESREGLPIGVQLVAARCREDVLLRVAAELEQAMPWWNRQPSLFVA